METFTITVRVNSRDAHYGGNVVAGARVLELFGDAVTGLTAVESGNEGLLTSWTEVKFLKTVHPGDFLQVTAEVVKKKNLRRFVRLTADRFIRGLAAEDASVETVEPAERVAEADGIIVIPYADARRGASQ